MAGAQACGDREATFAWNVDVKDGNVTAVPGKRAQEARRVRCGERDVKAETFQAQRQLLTEIVVVLKQADARHIIGDGRLHGTVLPANQRAGTMDERAALGLCHK